MKKALKKGVKKGTVTGKARGQRVQYQEQNIQETDTFDEDQDLYEQQLNEKKLKDQLILTEKELNEDMPSKMLSTTNPQASTNLTLYSFKENKFITDELVDQLVIHFSLEGDLIQQESNEAQINEEIKETRIKQIQEAKRQFEQDPDAAMDDDETVKKTLRNKFNYNERQCQTLNNQIREKGVSALPPPTQSYSSSISQWQIADSYIKQLGLEKQIKQYTAGQGDNKQEKSLYSATFKRCLKIMERMVVLNDNQEKYKDYKYYWTSGENVDSMKNEGHMLPIWRFSNEKQRKKHVTAVAWNPRYPDLFAVGLGSYEFLRQRMGLICIYSLKNTTHPEYSFTTEYGIMCLDFQPNSSALLAVGLYDGTVLVYDIRNKHKRPIYQSTVRTMKHTDPVWQVYWNPDTSKKYNFYSVSSDGRVMHWILMKNQLEPEEVIRLKLTGSKINSYSNLFIQKENADEETTLIGLAGGLCFDFNQFEPHIFIVGTEEGKIHKCSRAYSGQYLETYKGHLLAVYKVKWNNFHNRTFISASADWTGSIFYYILLILLTVKIWDSKYPSPIMSFDLGMAVVDAIWAPYSSTVFATATLEKVYVYDLNVDKHTKIAEQKPVKQPKLTNLAFNIRDPILLVGDTHGGVTLVKLSPNLTKGLNKKIPEDFSLENLNDHDKKLCSTFQGYQEYTMKQILTVVGKFQNEEYECEKIEKQEEITQNSQ